MLFSLGHSSFSCSQKAVQRNRGARDPMEHFTCLMLCLIEEKARENVREVTDRQSTRRSSNGLASRRIGRPSSLVRICDKRSPRASPGWLR